MAVQSLKDGDTNDGLQPDQQRFESRIHAGNRSLMELTVGLRVHLELKDQDITSMKVENPKKVPGAITSIDADSAITAGPGT